MADEGFEVVIYKASTIGEAPLLLSSLQRSDEYHTERKVGDTASLTPQEQKKWWCVVIMLLFFVAASCGLAISLVVIRNQASGKQTSGNEQISSVGSDDVPILSSIPTSAPFTIDASGLSPSPTRPPTPQQQTPSSATQLPVSLAPTSAPTPVPSPLVVVESSPRPTISTSGPTEYSIVLESGTSMFRGQAVYSPNGRYSLVMAESGDLILLSGGDEIIWRADGEGAERCVMQEDGNLLLRTAHLTGTWRSNTGDNDGAYLILDQGGQLAVVTGDADDITPLWLTGVPKGQGVSSGKGITFPVRGAFYFPWYPETWKVRGKPVIHTATLGRYSLEESMVHRNHVDALEYAHVNVAISSWFGQDKHLDRSRLTNLMNASKGTSVKWTVYHEMERKGDPSVSELRADLRYLKKWFTWHENWAHVDGKPVIFVYNSDGNCGVNERWMEAAGDDDDWYVVLKTFRDHDKCTIQPDSWHEYGPAKAVVHEEGYSYSISPGFWRVNREAPALPRLDSTEWRENVQSMVDSNEPWQLVATFNEWGDGTSVESGVEWESLSGYGDYLDALHEIE